MGIIFNPSGILDIATDPSDLPEQSDGRNHLSSALTRCKNIRQTRNGIAQTRYGSSKINASAISTPIWLILEQAGVRYSFAGSNIYNNESSIASGLTSAQWSAISYNAYNDTTKQVYALNGTDFKRIEGSSVYTWGITAPTDTPNANAQGAGVGTLTGTYSAKVTYCGLVGTVIVRESNPSTVSNSVALATASALMVTFDRPNEDQVTHVQVYRTLTNGSAWYADDTIPTPYQATAPDYIYTYSWEDTDAYISGTGLGFTSTDASNRQYTFTWELDYSTTTSMIYGISQWLWEPVMYCSANLDATLGSEVATTHDTPPAGTYIAGPAFDGTCFIIKDNLLYYSLAKQPEY